MYRDVAEEGRLLTISYTDANEHVLVVCYGYALFASINMQHARLHARAIKVLTTHNCEGNWSA